MFPNPLILLAAASVALSIPHTLHSPVALSSPLTLRPRTDATNITCTDATAAINEHNKNVALLSICGGISGAITKCEGNPTSTTGQSGDAKFTLNPTDAGATINISKGRWEQCIKSAEAACPGGQAYTATCPLGASTGDTNFELTKQ